MSAKRPKTVQLITGRKQRIISPQTEVTNTQKIITENGETVEMVTVTFGDDQIVETRAEPGDIEIHQGLADTHSQLNENEGTSLHVVESAEHELVVHTTPEGDPSDITYLASDQVVLTSDSDSIRLKDETGQTPTVSVWTDQPDDYTCCLVCGDRGSGFHYSVYSCEGCKGFFKRSVQKNLTYTCKNEGNCDITKYSRNNCQYCRFKKCLQFGMKKEGVRDDRAPGCITKSRFKKFKSGLSARSDDIQNSVPSWDLEAFLQTVVNSDPYISPAFVSSEEKTATLHDASQLTAVIYDDMTFTVKWATKLPGFTMLPTEDQKTLLRSSMMELSLFRLAFRSLSSRDGRLRFANDIELTLSEAEQLGFDQDYIDTVLEILERLRNLEIDDKEYAVMCGIILFYEDAIGLQCNIHVLKMQQKYIDILRRYIQLVFPSDDNGMKRYGRLLLRLPALRTLTMQISQVFEQFIISDRPDIATLVDTSLHDDVLISMVNG